MQTIPSLVGIGTAVAAAATGLVFGQVVDAPPPRPISNKRKTPTEEDNFSSTRTEGGPAPATNSRPATSSAAQPPSAVEDGNYHTWSRQSASTNIARQPRPLTTHFTPPKPSSRRQSFIRQGDYSGPAIVEDSRDSFSSNGSWMRRLSIRPLSQHGSPRSSVGPDSPSITFSHGSAAPILSPVGSLPPQLPPNKLVKRAAASYSSNAVSVTRRRSRSHLPTLRRPATSHQRSATLQQFQQSVLGGEPITSPKYSLDQQHEPSGDVLSKPLVEAREDPVEVGGWASFFHIRTARIFLPRGSYGRGSESNPHSRNAESARRVCVDTLEKTPAYLIRPSMVSSSTATGEVPNPAVAEPQSKQKIGDHSAPTPENTPSKRARRSISMHFPSPTNWISKTGSIRRSKRGQEQKGTGKRHVSAPIPSSQPAMRLEQGAREDVFTSQRRQSADLGVSCVTQSNGRARNSSSPLPPLSRLSSFNVDLNKLGATATITSQHHRPAYSSGPSQSQVLSQVRGSANERSFTMGSSDLEMRDFNSGDDDDTDFKSDTMFDSIRTVASGRVRNVETPLESMFDDSPPSTAGNNTKTKRLSIQEILGNTWDGDDRIMEEDEGVPTPVRGTLSLDSEFARHGAAESRFSFDPTNRDFTRLSLDDASEDDWARDDENPLSNHLSPPSSVASHSARTALASISGNGSPEALHSDTISERPLSNLFEWSESSTHDKHEADGQSPRPRTVHGRQEMDGRGGRSATRRGPTAAHIRSQSVPIVHDPPESTKSATKFGTWGLGTKTVSEDWDDDFEFEEPSLGGKEGKKVEKPFSMMVPASIQAAQPTVKAHSRQIQEFSLLVNDLKRLCKHGRELDILEGAQASLWKEAEGIIALASPDDDEMEGMDVDSTDFDLSTTDDRVQDDDRGADSLDRAENSFDGRELAVSRTGVVRQRHPGRRRSVFSPEDDIFGGNGAAPDEKVPPPRPQTPDHNAVVNGHDINTVVQSMMEAMQNRSASDPLHGTGNKLHFGTSSLRALVKRAGDLRDALSNVVRTADPIAPSPARTPRHDRHDRHDGSPAFTRLFTEPSSSPPRHLPHSRGSNSGLGRPSMESSPSNAIAQRMVMTVN